MQIEVAEGNASTQAVDVLALKYAQDRYGLDRLVSEQLLQAGVHEHDMSPAPGDFSVVPGSGVVAAKHVLWVGTAALPRILYRDMTVLARTALVATAKAVPAAKSLGVTLHGVNFGLDEGGVFLSMIAGFDDAIQEGTVHRLERIVFIENKPNRADFLRRFLADLLPDGHLPNGSERSGQRLTESLESTRNRFRAVTAASATRRHAFVAMPFAEEFEDIYEYAIQNAVNRAGLLCERADLTSFTGDILAHVQERIRSAAFLIAELSSANPNVYLELGYAWGCGTPCVLLVRDAGELKFDVRGQRCLVYKRMKELEDKLSKELGELARAASNSALQLTWPSRSLGPRS